MSSKQRSKRKRFDSCNSKLQQLDPASKEQVHKLFEKTFTYKQPTDIRVNPESHGGFEQTEKTVELKKDLTNLKERLNNVKDSLSDKDIVSWHQHTKFMHIAGSVMQELKTAFHIELCTQAWCKFYEILNKFPIISQNCKEINSVHLCEAPGAFISALNHQLKYRELQDHWQWLASTLSPYHEGNSLNYMIDDDWFIRETLDHWYFGQDGTGNLMNYTNIEALVDKVSDMNGIQLVTADGSIDCQNSPAEQEMLVSDLHYYETLTSLKLLEIGGCFVIKIFTMFEERTITLLYLLNTTFKQVSVFKPATSKPGNSEVYIVCEHYTAQLTSDTFQQIFDNECIPNKQFYPESFLKQHVLCCEQFVNYQIEAIEININTYQQLTTETERWQMSLREYCQEVFITKYNLRRIPEYSQIVYKHSKVKCSSFFLDKDYDPPEVTEIKEPLCQFNKVNGPKSRLSGSFEDRQKQNDLPWKSQLQQMEPYRVSHDKFTLQCTNKLKEEDIKEWRVRKEKILKSIESSRFCDNRIVSCYNKILNYCPLHIGNKQFTVNNKKLCETLINQLLQDSVGSNSLPILYSYNTNTELDLELQSSTEIESVILKSLEDVKSANNGTVYCDIVKSNISEVNSQTKRDMLVHVKEILMYLPTGCSVILKVSTCLTRYMVGFIFLLSRLFIKTSFRRIPQICHLQQLLYLQVYNGSLDNLQTYLQSVLVDLDNMTNDQSDMTVVEIAPLMTIFKDYQFMKFINHTNRNTLIEFINSTIMTEKQSLPDQYSKQNQILEENLNSVQSKVNTDSMKNVSVGEQNPYTEIMDKVYEGQETDSTSKCGDVDTNPV